jgi:glycosyltransferase involved in cell wall biosynthesis
MRFSIIVPVYDTSAHLQRCIQSLVTQDYPRDGFEILMVDNGSTDASPGILRAAAGIRVLCESTRGSYAARNRGVREARGEVLAFTDSDCIPAPDWLRAIDHALQRHGTQVVLGCRRPAHERGLARLLADYENKKDEFVFASEAPRSYYGFTNNMAVPRETMARFGPFVERPRGSDTIFVRRVVEGAGCGAVVYEPSMRITHTEMDGAGAYYRKMYTYGRSRRQYGHIMTTEPLGNRDRIRQFRETIRHGHYSWLSAAVLAVVLAGGMAAWSLGSHSHAWSKTPVR